MVKIRIQRCPKFPLPRMAAATRGRFVPPVPAVELAHQLARFREHGDGLLETIIAGEVADGAAEIR